MVFCHTRGGVRGYEKIPYPPPLFLDPFPKRTRRGDKRDIPGLERLSDAIAMTGDAIEGATASLALNLPSPYIHTRPHWCRLKINL